MHLVLYMYNIYIIYRTIQMLITLSIIAYPYLYLEITLNLYLFYTFFNICLFSRPKMLPIWAVMYINIYYNI